MTPTQLLVQCSEIGQRLDIVEVLSGRDRFPIAKQSRVSLIPPPLTISSCSRRAVSRALAQGIFALFHASQRVIGETSLCLLELKGIDPCHTVSILR